jgi:hypothetical protein
MLWALSDVVATVTDKEKFPRYYDKEVGNKFKNAANQTLKALSAAELTSVKDTSTALTALEWYAAVAPDKKEEIVKLANNYAEKLQTIPHEKAAQHALVVRGMTSAYRITEDMAYLETAKKHYQVLQKLWDEKAGVYATSPDAKVYTYTPFDVGAIVGALHATKEIVGPELQDDSIATQAAQRLAAFYTNAVEKSGMQASGEALKDGKFGRANTANAEVQYDTNSGNWKVTNNRFVTEDNMYLANELIWLLDTEGLIQPYPEIK